MTARFRQALSLSLLLLGAPALEAQTVPALPPATAPTQPSPAEPPLPEPVPTEPVPAEPVPTEPAPPAPTPVEPAPVEPAPVEPVPVEPAPVEPTPPTPPKPAPPKPPPVSRAPLLITVQTEFPVLKGGRKTSLAFSQTLTIPGARMAVIRERGTITASLDADLKAFLDELSAPAQDARFEPLWDGWAVVQRNGLKLDREATRAALLKAVQAPGGVRANVVVTGQVPPRRTLDYFLSRGITAHLGTGTTNYAGSSANRIKNIHVGASRFQDRLVEGGVVSFNQIVGPVTAKAGFVDGLVISGDRTATGVGGGICQVSTTVFRTLYQAGLPIRERQNHSYQVYYYAPQGLDATIYQPTLDLKFANDTGGALWFQSEWNDAETRLDISVFGRARDFTVQVAAPRTLSTTPPPADRLIPDATLPAGQKKQVDWAAPGAVIEVTRKFVRAGKVFKQDTLRSTYRPWPNIFLVGRR